LGKVQRRNFWLSRISPSPIFIFMHYFKVHMETSTWVLAVSDDRYGVLQTGKPIPTFIPVLAGSKSPPSKQQKKSVISSERIDTGLPGKCEQKLK